MLRAIYRSLGVSRSSRGHNTVPHNTTHVYTNESDSEVDDDTSLTPTAPPLPPERPPRRRLTRTEAMERLRELLECSICLEELQDPRVLPCHHSFCLSCLHKIRLGESRVLRCPNCNLEVCLQRGVEELPSDFRTNALRECLPEEEGEEGAGCTADAATALPAFNTSSTVLGLVTCPVCEEMLTEPRCLDCGHSFCLGCLEFMMPMSGCTIHCPCCAGQTVVQDGVAALPVDAAKSHMMDMFSPPSTAPHTELYSAPPSTATNTATTPGAIYTDPSQQSEFNQTPTPAPQGAAPTDNPNTERPQDVRSILLTCLRDLRAVLPAVSTSALVRFNTLTSLCLGCFLGGVLVASTNWESDLLQLLLSVLTWLGPLFVLAGVLLLVFGLSGRAAGGADVGVHERQKAAGWIGEVVGAEVLVYYSAVSNQGIFYATAGALFGCVAICLAVLSSPGYQATISTRSFIEGLAWKTIPFVMLGGLYGTGIIDSILFPPTVCMGVFVGTLTSTHILGLLSRNNIRVRLSRYNAYITLRGALLGNMSSAVLLRLLHPRVGAGRCLITGAALGTGIGLIFGDIYLPWVRWLLEVPAADVTAAAAADVTAAAAADVTAGGSSTQRRLILAVGTAAGGVLGFVTTSQIFGVLIGALLGLYFAEQGMDTLRVVFNDVLQLYVHCAVGALVGTCLGLLVALGYNSPLWGPLLGVVIETGILQLYMHDHGINGH